jgi:hypothetical protein
MLRSQSQRCCTAWSIVYNLVFIVRNLVTQWLDAATIVARQEYLFTAEQLDATTTLRCKRFHGLITANVVHVDESISARFSGILVIYNLDKNKNTNKSATLATKKSTRANHVRAKMQ